MGNGGIDVWDGLQAEGRYVRIYMTQPAVVTYGIHFFEVYSPDAGCLQGTATQIPEPLAFDMAIYPNPFVDQVRIRTGDNAEMERVEVWDTAGQRIWSSRFRPTLDLTWLPAGAYFVKVTDGNGRRVVQRIVKQR